MGVLHGEDSHNQSSACFKDKLWSWKGRGGHCRTLQSSLPRAVPFAPGRPSVPPLEDFSREVAFALVPGLQVIKEGEMGRAGRHLQQMLRSGPGCHADRRHLRSRLVQQGAVWQPCQPGMVVQVL